MDNNDTNKMLKDMEKKLQNLEKEKRKKNSIGCIPIMDQITLKYLCIDNDGFETPELNDSLLGYAHFKGFNRIEGLENYYNLKAIWLDSNGFNKIENLFPLKKLRCLYLSKNLIRKIENIHMLTNLITLDLSENCIKKIEGLSSLLQLTTLNISRNLIETKEDIIHLNECLQLTNIDISHNKLNDPNCLDIFYNMKNLKALRIVGNEIVSKTKQFRKNMISKLPQLGFLDRPIFDIERISIKAWSIGGPEAELKARQDFKKKENDKSRETMQEFRNWQNQIRQVKMKEIEKLRKTGDYQTTIYDLNIDGSLSNTVQKYYKTLENNKYNGKSENQIEQEKEEWKKRLVEAKETDRNIKNQVKGDGIKEMGKNYWAKGIHSKDEYEENPCYQ